MRAIVVGIDFLNESLAALKLAINFAVRSNSKIIMVFVNKHDLSKPIFRTPADNIKEVVENQFKKLVLKYSEKISAENISYLFKEGQKVNDVINEVATDNRADLIVIGTHGTIGLKLFSHSLAFRTIKDANVPVITIRDGARIADEIKKVLIPIDDSLETRQKIPFSVRLAKIYGAEVHLLAIYHSSVETIKENIERYTRQSAEYLEKNNIDFVVKSIETTDIVNETIKYSNLINADIISIMTTQISKVSNIWKGSIAEQLIDQSPIPVATIPSKELLLTLSR